jgi:hypothetical protein
MGAINLHFKPDVRSIPLGTSEEIPTTAGVVPPSRPRRNKPGKQKALFNDAEVRRDYLKSKQWCEQHMRIKVHITGFACAYEHIGGAHHKRDPDRQAIAGRYQGSLYSQQKHAIADAVEWIRRNSKYKPRIFVATTPGFLDHAKEGKFISQLVHNLKNGYGMENYVWVRELTENGYPHFHFVADIDKINPVDISVYWSSLFGSGARNSIRFGSKPDAKGRRLFWIKNPRMCWYLTKYIGKSIGDAERSGNKKSFRTFAISQEARKKSQPVVYHSYAVEHYGGFRSREFTLPLDTVEELLTIHENSLPPTSLNPRLFSWRWTGHGQTFIGFRKLKPNTS